MKGHVVRMFPDKMFGFIRAEDGDEYFFHASNIDTRAINTNLDFRLYIRQGARVEFDGVDSDRGKRALNILLEEDNR